MNTAEENEARLKAEWLKRPERFDRNADYSDELRCDYCGQFPGSCRCNDRSEDRFA